MMKNFNLQGFYGYFIPGFVLLALLYLPLYLFENRWPSSDLLILLFAIIAAYITGYVLQVVAESALPSSVKDASGEETLPLAYERRLAQIIKEKFGISDEELKKISSVRSEAFMLCRNALSSKASQSERFERLLIMARGISAAFALSAVYHLGWAIARRLPPTWEATACLVIGALLLIGVAGAVFVTEVFQRGRESTGRARSSFAQRILAVAIVVVIFWVLVGEFVLGLMSQRWPWVLVSMGLTMALLARLIPDSHGHERLNVWIARGLALMKIAPILITFLALGYSLGSPDVEGLEDRSKLGFITLVSLLFALTFFNSYRHMALEFPKAVYREFYLQERSKARSDDEV